MKLPRLLLPAVGALAVVASPATSLADHKVTVYRDLDHDGHFNKKTFEAPGHRFYYRGGRRYYGGGYPYYGYGYPYGYPYGYGYGPSVSLSFGGNYPAQSAYSDDLGVDVQRELRRRGYYRGAIDGDIGPGTREAIRAYQYDRGLSVSGRIDHSLLHSLGIG